ncbi:hypothetical protein D9M72_416880 [compost metagenome]
MHDLEAVGLGLARRRRRVSAAGQVDRALVRTDDAAEHLDQRGLSGAVLADQAMHFAWLNRKADAVQRLGAAEGLPDIVQLQNGPRRNVSRIRSH